MADIKRDITKWIVPIFIIIFAISFWTFIRLSLTAGLASIGITNELVAWGLLTIVTFVILVFAGANDKIRKKVLG